MTVKMSRAGRDRALVRWCAGVARAAAVCAACVGLVACGGATGGGTGGTTAASGGNSGALAGGSDIAGKEVLFAVQSSPSNSFFVPVVNGAKAAAAMTGVKLQIQYGNDDDSTHVRNVQAGLASGIVGLAASIPTKALDKVLCDARAKNVSVVAFNINGATGAGAKCVQAFVGQDFVQSGRLIAQKALADGRLKRGDKAFCPVELPTQTYAVQRYQGVSEVLKANGISCEIVGTGVDLAPAKSKMVSYLLGHKDTAAIVALGGTPLAEAPAAVKQVGKKIPIVGFDLSEPILDGIQAGTINASIDQQPYAQGFYAVMQIALNLKYALSPASLNTSGSALVDKSNVEKVTSLVPDYR